MLRLESRLDSAAPGQTRRSLSLCYAERCKSRLRVALDDGSEAGLFLPRGTILRGGDALQADDGTCVLVISAVEDLYEVRAASGSADPHFDLLRAAYHLGNRHVPVQLSPLHLRLERDAVLRELLLRLGLDVTDIVAPFEPEAGAYGGGHRHDHDTPGGTLGERLSREAHGLPVGDLSSLRFDPLR